MPEDLSTVADDGEVTVAEAQAVIDGHNEIYNDAILGLLTRPDAETGGSGAEFNAQLGRIYTDGLLGVYGAVWNDSAREGFPGLDQDDPEGISEEVTEIIEVRPDCVEIRLERDLGGIESPTRPPTSHWLTIVNTQPGPMANPTGWYRDFETEGDPEASLCDLKVDS